MQLRAEQLEAHLKASSGQGFKPVYTLQGDEPLLLQEAADAIRATARAAGFQERKVFTVAGAHFDWSAVLAAAQSMSLFAEQQLIEIRIPSGKPGKDGSEALQRYVDALPGPEVLTLVTLPSLDFQQSKSAWVAALDSAGISIKFDPVPRAALPQWIAKRLAAQGQRVVAGEEGEQTLKFFADRVEGNLLAAHQEIQKLALLHPAGELSLAQIEAVVLNVARFDVRQLCEAVLAGQTARALRILQGLRAEGESVVAVHWPLADDIRALKRVRDALDAGRPLPMAMGEARVWGLRQRQIERLAPLLASHTLAHWLEAASEVDGINKGFKRAGWPLEPWAAMQRLVLMMLEHTAAPPAAQRKAGLRLALAAG
jgi:DNA polymerase III subunit delta